MNSIGTALSPLMYMKHLIGSMRQYSITYITDTGNTVITKLSAPNRFLLTMEIYQEIKDMKDKNADNIIAIEEV